MSTKHIKEAVESALAGFSRDTDLGFGSSVQVSSKTLVLRAGHSHVRLTAEEASELLEYIRLAKRFGLL